MIGLDTNVVVRFLAQDDKIQSPIATRLISRLNRDRPGFISSVVLAEITWVLSRAYKTSREDIAKAVEGLLRSAELIVENPDAAYRALGLYQTSNSAEFADALIAQLALLAGAVETVTFDQNAASALSMRRLR
ncbi:PIN domain-containing protein [Candidatus Viadribacter manganicus]|uniref:Twitching motility protein PilT n=1 Tax=Candidatus Viadribacter manganicus TaxID=1759059 RepID=A0A1B1AGV3_9PROT|nr:type II toxin-antitoxin system VapC family toxin [Candidatus Viadribacter manganicus]ANP45792.1 twitching motility protein PilT [Candidatus Viadribacter manganicus]